MKAWTITQLESALQHDLTLCHSNFERINVVAIGGRDIRESAIEWSKVRKLTPGEVAIAQKYGYRSA